MHQPYIPHPANSAYLLYQFTFDGVILIISTSGTEFFHEVGYLGIGPSSDKYLTGLISAAQTQNFPFRELTTLELRQICPYMNISAEYSCGILIERDAGYINPRDMVAAQKICAEKAGCEIINDVVRRIIPPREADGYNVLITDNGRLFYSRKILLATGAFTHCRRLLPREVQPDVALQAEAMAMVCSSIYCKSLQCKSLKMTFRYLSD